MTRSHGRTLAPLKKPTKDGWFRLGILSIPHASRRTLSYSILLTGIVLMFNPVWYSLNVFPPSPPPTVT